MEIYKEEKEIKNGQVPVTLKITQENLSNNIRDKDNILKEEQYLNSKF